MQFGADPHTGLVLSSAIRHGALVVEAAGELDYRAAVLLREELSRYWDVPGVPAVVLDLTAVTFCDSVGLSELIATLRRSEETGRALMISGVQGTLLRVLTITGLRNAFDTYETIDEALLRVPPTTADAAEAITSTDAMIIGDAVNPGDTTTGIGAVRHPDATIAAGDAMIAEDAVTDAVMLQQRDLPPPDPATPTPAPQA
ncbi:STAS domain-containing protein [Sphaerisporangium dianthi]|uniref:Anti-sigma factor antagonist n=1 Tax=Sphaerisporangium dianthi TaxID=1436120 RepID=A0ABV9C7Z0_9ACTN